VSYGSDVRGVGGGSNPNATSKEAAALVAFFNGYVTDTRTISVHIKGTNWYIVGRWAALRAIGDNPQPIGIKFWEFGNEVYTSMVLVTATT
jgi:hypothetical protein